MEQKKEEIKKETEKEQTIVVKKPTKALFKKKQKFKQLTLFDKNDFVTKDAVKTRVLIPRVKYKGPLSYRGIRMIAFLFWFMAIFAGFFPIFAAIQGGDVDTAEKVASFFEWTQQIVLPLFLVSAFSMIIARKNETIQTILRFVIFALFIYLGTIFVFEHYVLKFAAITHPEMSPAELRAFANEKVISELGEVIHSNVFLDMSLCCLFYFFFVWEPKKLKGKKLFLFRLCSILPVLYVVASMVLFGLFNNGVIKLTVASYALLVCRSPAVYLVFLLLSIFMKVREKVFIKMGGNAEQYQSYLKSKANTLHFSLFYSITLAAVSLIDFVMSFIPNAESYCFGTSYMMFLAIPFVMLLSYNKDYKNKSLDAILPVAFVSALAFVMLELVFQFLVM